MRRFPLVLLISAAFMAPPVLGAGVKAPSPDLQFQLVSETGELAARAEKKRTTKKKVAKKKTTAKKKPTTKS
jgi:hypothetical protein